MDISKHLVFFLPKLHALCVDDALSLSLSPSLRNVFLRQFLVCDPIQQFAPPIGRDIKQNNMRRPVVDTLTTHLPHLQ